MLSVAVVVVVAVVSIGAVAPVLCSLFVPWCAIRPLRSKCSMTPPVKEATLKRATHRRTVESGQTLLRGNVNYTAEERGTDKSTSELKSDGSESSVRC